MQEREGTAAFYAGLNNSVFWDFDLGFLDYLNAWDLYEYALYQWNHNTTIANSSFTYDDLVELENLASQQQFGFNSPTSNSTINAIAGRTLAAAILTQLEHTIASSGVSDKLTLMFGSYEPFLAFFALSNLSTGPSAARFNSLPEHGSVMSFELFSYATSDQALNLSTPFPSTDALWVRFLFRNGTGDTDALTSYPLFGRGNSEVDMTWADFTLGMGDFYLNNPLDWCTECGASTVTLFCEAFEANVQGSTNSTSKRELSPVIGGVIGATITLGLCIFTAIALYIFGFRLDHHSKDEKRGDLGVMKRKGSGNGGFKGAEKLASDTDLRLKGGAGATVVRHERVGSWELNESPTGNKKHLSLDNEMKGDRVVSRVDYRRHSEDDIGIGNVNPFGDPVKPHDQV